MQSKESSLSVGFFLAVREIKRSSKATTMLIIFVMTLTFINMNLVGGILIGLATGVLHAYEQYYSGNVVIVPATDKNTIERTGDIIASVKTLPTLSAISQRFAAPALLEYNYKKKLRTTDLSESATGLLTGINPKDEDAVTHLSGALVAGSFLNESDVDKIVVGGDLTEKYSTVRGAANNIGSKILKHVDVGSKVRITVNGLQKDVTIKGVISTNATNIDDRIFMVDTAARQLMGRTSLNASEIAIALTDNASAGDAKNYLIKNTNHDPDIIIETATDALPTGISQIFLTFSILGNLVGGIALIVGAITIFIVIFVNALARKKYIGILKGIGIAPQAIEFSYVLQAVFYASAGIIVASIILLELLAPYFLIHPINFPIAKGYLSVLPTDVALRSVVLLFVAVISGFIPSWIVVRQNTLDSILGR